MAKIDTTRFRNPQTNQRYTSQLFWDMWRDLPIEKRIIDPMFSLHDDVEGLINFRTEYVRDMDPTGYKTANRLLENYDHWNLLMRGKWFKDAKKEWDKELSAKMEAESLTILRSIQNGGEDVPLSQKIAAAKVLLGKSKTVGEGKGESLKRGRPTKEEVKGELKEQARLTKEEQEDLARITPNISVLRKDKSNNSNG